MHRHFGYDLLMCFTQSVGVRFEHDLGCSRPSSLYYIIESLCNIIEPFCDIIESLCDIIESLCVIIESLCDIIESSCDIIEIPVTLNSIFYACNHSCL